MTQEVNHFECSVGEAGIVRCSREEVEAIWGIAGPIETHKRDPDIAALEATVVDAPGVGSTDKADKVP